MTNHGAREVRGMLWIVDAKGKRVATMHPGSDAGMG
jgi:hypothetical protein